MNFTEFSFWWLLVLLIVPFLVIRYVGERLQLWQESYDRIGLMILSLVLFFNASTSSFIIFVFEIIFNYAMVCIMLRRSGWEAKAIAVVAIVIDVGILAYFKYLHFFLTDVLGVAVRGIGGSFSGDVAIPGVRAIPPGLSFYTFEMVSFIVDSFASKRKKPVGFIEYVNFVTFFPHVVAGPIERKSTLFPQMQKFRFQFSAEDFEVGLRWLVLGLFMKLVLGDNITPFIEYKETANPWMVWLSVYLFTLRIYFDFAGYSFMAVGIGRCMGVKLTLNFLAPYTSVSIQEFWRRWHITLNNWFRDYIFLPLMGSQKHWAAFYLFITFTLSGFWHGAAWNFILWGAYHGALLLVLRYAGRPFQRIVGKYFPSGDFISWALTFASVTFGCLFFMETNSHRLIEKLQTIFSPWAYSFSNLGDLFGSYTLNSGAALIFTLVLANGFLFLEHLAVWQKRENEYDLLLSPWVARTMLALTILLAANQPSQFIYFDF